MPTLDEIKSDLMSIKDGKSISKMSEVKELPRILRASETVLDAIRGQYKDKWNGLLLATNERLLFISQSTFIKSLSMEDFPLSKISSIEFEQGFVFGTITIYTSGNKAQIKKADKDYCITFCEHVRNLIHEHSSNNINNVNTKNNEDDLIAKLERLANLKAQGMLTDEEFILAKKKLLS